MYGYAHDEFTGLPPTHFIHPDSALKFTEYVQAIQSHGTDIDQQVHMHRDGSNFHVELSGRIYSENGRSYLLSVVRDASQRVKAEQLLQQRVEERTREQSTLQKFQTLASAPSCSRV
jgi:PAS domain S-box-containing protein